MLERCNKLLSSARELSMDSILITSPVNRGYFSGFTGTAGCLLITARKRILFTDFRYTIQAREQTKGLFEVREVSGKIGAELIGAELNEQKCKYCGFEDEAMTVAEHNSIKHIRCDLGGISSVISKIRKVKTADEIENLIKAQNIADKSFSELIDIMLPGMSETDVAAELEYLLKKNGAECTSFDTIVGSGPNGALCHAMPGARKLTHGDMVVIDFGCKYNGYCSDMTRTVAVGKPKDELMRIYKIVREAQALTLKAVKPGISGKALDSIARECIKAHGFGENFGHSLGHGFGLEIHEAPYASVRSTDILESGMTITVEPGIYVEGLGGVRIEDCVILTDDGHINPVTSTKDLIIIE